MQKKNLNMHFRPSEQTRLYFYEKYFSLFTDLYEKNLLPNQILLSGNSGIGKSTFAYHFVNYVLSKNELNPYDSKNFHINYLNKSFRLVNQNCHPNFFLIDIFEEKHSIDVKQIRNMINYANKTSYDKNIKFILINNAEYLNIHSINALLKIVEEPTSNTFFVFIHNSCKRISDTLKSRCIEFKMFFTNNEKHQILNLLLKQFNIKFNINFKNEIFSFYDTPGVILNYTKFFEEQITDSKETNLKNIILNLMDFNKTDRSHINLFLLQNIIELFFYTKIVNTNNKVKVFANYSKAINHLNNFKKYNIDMNNTFYEIKENIIHA